MIDESYRKVSIPKGIVDQAEKLAQDKRLGYTSTSELIRDAVRRLICTLRTKQAHLNHTKKREE